MENVSLILDLISVSPSKLYRHNSMLLIILFFRLLEMQLDRIMELYLLIALFQDQLQLLDQLVQMLNNKQLLLKLNQIISILFYHKVVLLQD